jgi:4-hydroxybenzoate polyprenyltransferase
MPSLSHISYNADMPSQSQQKDLFGIPSKFGQRYLTFWRLMRMDKPIGIALLLWPTLWSLWLAANLTERVFPEWSLIVIFVLGTILMRAAGCCLNDYADRNFDGHVKRTNQRPLATGEISNREALLTAAVLILLAFILVLLTNPLTVMMSLGAVILSVIYPFMKRYTHLAQLFLGAAFSWGGLMAFTSQTNLLPLGAWLVFAVNILWILIYDTEYAMVDRDDDVQLSLKSTAILFGSHDKLIVGILQFFVLYGLYVIGHHFQLFSSYSYPLSLLVVAALFTHQQWLIRHRHRESCLKAFIANHWVGFAVFLGIILPF